MKSNFFVRLWRSAFGIKKISRMISLSLGRKKVVAALRAGQPLSSRRDVYALLGVPVLLHETEVPVLQKYAALAPQTIVEIGCAYGGSSLIFLLAKKDDARLHSIDPFVVDSMDTFQATQTLCYGHVTKALRDTGRGARIADWKLIPDYSYNVVKTWTTPIDAIFIDGDHTYAAVKQDYEHWLPLVKPSGYIFFHDSCRIPGTADGVYNRGWPGPTDLVKELERDSRVTLVEKVHSISVFKKAA